MSGINGYPGYVRDIVQGESRKIKVHPIFTDENGVVQSVTLSDYDFKITFAADLDTSTPADLEVTVPAGTGLDSELTTVEINVNATQTAGLPVGEEYYQITMINASDSSEAHIMDMGKINILPAV